MTEEERNIELNQIEDDKSLLAVMGLMVREITSATPNDAKLGKEVRQLIKDYKLNTDKLR